MYNPDGFRVDDENAAIKFVEQHSFAIVTSTVDDELIATHCPMHFMSSDKPRTLFGHFARLNPHCAALNRGTKMLCVFAGPHTYVSPTWYTGAPAVPTWNYTTVHVAGTATVIDDPAIFKEQLMILTRRHDAKAPLESLMPDKYMRGMMKGIVGFELQVTSIQMKLKLSQNKSKDDQTAVMQQLEKSSGSDQLAIAVAMKKSIASQ